MSRASPFRVAYEQSILPCGHGPLERELHWLGRIPHEERPILNLAAPTAYRMGKLETRFLPNHGAITYSQAGAGSGESLERKFRVGDNTSGIALAVGNWPGSNGGLALLTRCSGAVLTCTVIKPAQLVN